MTTGATLAVDTETTGTHDNAEIAQLGMILYAPDRRVLGEFKSLILPDGWTMPDETQKFHTKNGSTVSQENCERYGITLRSALALFDNWCRKASTLVAFNMVYDLGRVRYAADRIGLQIINLPPNRACAMEMSTALMKIPPTAKMVEWGHGNKFKNPKLAEAYEFFFKRKLEGAHDALADVRAAAEIYFHIIEGDKNP